MGDQKDKNLIAVKSEFEGKILDYLRSHSSEILTQVESDEEYQSCKRDVPKVPLFTEYLTGLEADISTALRKVGIMNGAAKELTKEYYFRFYRVWLPDVLSQARTRREAKNKPY